jgi:BMFP domain-containing protein YqiC
MRIQISFSMARDVNTYHSVHGRGILRYHFDVSHLVPLEMRDDDPDILRARMVELEAVVAGRSAEVARVKSNLAAFGIDYRKRVGLLHERLDKLEAEITEAELGELSKQRQRGSDDPHEPSASAPSDAQSPRRDPSAAVATCVTSGRVARRDERPDQHGEGYGAALQKRHHTTADPNPAPDSNPARKRW